MEAQIKELKNESHQVKKNEVQLRTEVNLLIKQRETLETENKQSAAKNKTLAAVKQRLQ